MGGSAAAGQCRAHQPRGTLRGTAGSPAVHCGPGRRGRCSGAGTVGLDGQAGAAADLCLSCPLPPRAAGGPSTRQAPKALPGTPSANAAAHRLGVPGGPDRPIRWCPERLHTAVRCPADSRYAAGQSPHRDPARPVGLRPPHFDLGSAARRPRRAISGRVSGGHSFAGRSRSAHRRPVGGSREHRLLLGPERT